MAVKKFNRTMAIALAAGMTLGVAPVVAPSAMLNTIGLKAPEANAAVKDGKLEANDVTFEGIYSKDNTGKLVPVNAPYNSTNLPEGGSGTSIWSFDVADVNAGDVIQWGINTKITDPYKNEPAESYYWGVRAAISILDAPLTLNGEQIGTYSIDRGGLTTVKFTSGVDNFQSGQVKVAVPVAVLNAYLGSSGLPNDKITNITGSNDAVVTAKPKNGTTTTSTKPIGVVDFIAVLQHTIWNDLYWFANPNSVTLQPNGAVYVNNMFFEAPGDDKSFVATLKPSYDPSKKSSPDTFWQWDDVNPELIFREFDSSNRELEPRVAFSYSDMKKKYPNLNASVVQTGDTMTIKCDNLPDRFKLFVRFNDDEDKAIAKGSYLAGGGIHIDGTYTPTSGPNAGKSRAIPNSVGLIPEIASLAPAAGVAHIRTVKTSAAIAGQPNGAGINTTAPIAGTQQRFEFIVENTGTIGVASPILTLPNGEKKIIEGVAIPAGQKGVFTYDYAVPGNATSVNFGIDFPQTTVTPNNHVFRVSAAPTATQFNPSYPAARTLVEQNKTSKIAAPSNTDPKATYRIDYSQMPDGRFISIDQKTGAITIAPSGTSTPGYYDIPVVVTYPDNSTETIYAYAGVTGPSVDVVKELEDQVKDANTKIDDLNKDITNLEKQIEDLKKDEAKNSDKIKELEKQLEDAKKNQENAKERIENLEKELAQAKEDAAKTKEELIKTQEQLAKEIERSKEAEQQLQDKIKDLNKQLDDAKKDITKNAELIKQLEDELGKTKDELTKVKQDLAVAENEIKHLEKDLANAIAETKAVESRLNDQIKDAKERIKELEKDAKANAKEIAELQTQVAVQETELKYTKERVAELEKALDAAQKQIAELEKNLDAEIERSKQVEKQLQDKVNDLQNQLDEARKDITKNADKIKQLEAELEKTKQELLAETKAVEDRLNDKIANLEAELSVLEQDVRTNEQEIANVKQELANTQADLAATKDRVKSLEDELAQTKEDLSNEINRAKEVEEALRKEISATQDELNTANGKISVLEGAVARAQQTADDAQAAADALRKDLTATQADLAAADATAKEARELATKALAELEAARAAAAAQDARIAELEKQVGDLAAKMKESDQRNAELEKKADELAKDLAKTKEDVIKAQQTADEALAKVIVSVTRNADNSITLTRQDGTTLTVPAGMYVTEKRCEQRVPGSSTQDGSLLPVMMMMLGLATTVNLPDEIDQQIIAFNKAIGIHDDGVAAFIDQNRGVIGGAIAGLGILALLMGGQHMTGGEDCVDVPAPAQPAQPGADIAAPATVDTNLIDVLSKL